MTEVVEQSFFDGIEETDGRLRILKYILQDWGDEDCVRILRNVGAALQGASSKNDDASRVNCDTRLLIIEH